MKPAWMWMTIVLLAARSGAPAHATGEEGAQMSEHRSRVETSGIGAEWHFAGDELVMEVSAPTIGWIAVGFNHSSDIVGAELFMAARRGNVTAAEHQFVVRAGSHPCVESLGRQSALIDAEVSTSRGRTQVVFRLDPELIPAVRAGQEMYLILAYSVSPDFDHHSRVRRHLSVRL